MNGFRGGADVFYALPSGHCALNTAIAQESSKEMGSKLEILKLDPTAGIAGGELVISCAGFDTSEPSLCSIWLNNTEAPIVALGSKRVLALVPEARHSGEVAVTLQSGNRKSTARVSGRAGPANRQSRKV